MSVLQVLYSLWQSERTPEERVNMVRLLPESISREVLEAVESAEKQAFSVGFKCAMELMDNIFHKFLILHIPFPFKCFLSPCARN